MFVYILEHGRDGGIKEVCWVRWVDAPPSTLVAFLKRCF